jgi:hypothetical protein
LYFNSVFKGKGLDWARRQFAAPARRTIWLTIHSDHLVWAIKQCLQVLGSKVWSACKNNS